MKDPDFKCCKCSKTKSHKHEELHQFGPYGNNLRKINDNNLYCEHHFLQMEQFYDRKSKNCTANNTNDVQNYQKSTKSKV